MSQLAVAYIPVLHSGYVSFIKRHAYGGRLLLIGPELTAGYRPIEKEIRALRAIDMAFAINALGICDSVEILDSMGASQLAMGNPRLVLPDEDISRMVAEKYFQRCHIMYDTVFLRWDRRNTVALNEVQPHRAIPVSELDKQFMAQAKELAKGSSDWWRHVGGLAVKDGKVLLSARNDHVPSQHTPYANGDPRGNFYQGVHLELSTVIHVEARIVAEAARLGVSLEGAEMYVTDFPCPPCAKQVAYSGISRLYYSEGYAVLDGQDVLDQQGVEIIRVDLQS
ncbi:MAG TPA: deaminase [Candidatus Dormibacteraeota bacterium]|nr:deaminase [Candidatus Dormibacteraeota bacterium]